MGRREGGREGGGKEWPLDGDHVNVSVARVSPNTLTPPSLSPSLPPHLLLNLPPPLVVLPNRLLIIEVRIQGREGGRAGPVPGGEVLGQAGETEGDAGFLNLEREGGTEGRREGGTEGRREVSNNKKNIIYIISTTYI